MVHFTSDDIFRRKIVSCWEAPFRKFPGWIFCTNSCVNDRQVSAHVCPHMGTVGLRAINKLFDSTENKTQVSPYDQTLADLTGRHYLQATGRNLETSPSEIKRFIGMSLMMGCISMKRLRMYWQRSTRIPVIADCMPRDRFFKLRNHFTVVDNNLFTDEAKAADRFWKVRPFMERMRRACLTLPREGNMSIDEQLISFTGLNNFVLAGASGLVLDFELYQGAGSFQQYQMDGKKAGQGTGAVLRLCESLSLGHRLFCDRFFTTLPLISHMLDKGIYLTGTIAKRNLPVATLRMANHATTCVPKYGQISHARRCVPFCYWLSHLGQSCTLT